MAVESADRGTESSTVGPLSGWTLDAVVSVLSVLLVAGVALDFRRHVGGISFAEEGFFTTEHVFFYSMFLAIAAVVGAATVARRRDGATWVEAVPRGYGWAVVGVVVFGLGGLGDLAWHTAFGFEEGVEALTSPSHLALAAGAALYLASPLRAAWYRDADYGGLRSLPVVVSASLVLSLVALFGGYLNPVWQLWHQPVPVPSVGQFRLALGIGSLAVFPVVLLGGATALLRRFDLPFGALTVTVLAPGLVSTLIHGRYEFLLPVVAAGLAADLLAVWRRPTAGSARVVRAYGALVPMAFVAVYHAVVFTAGGHPWTVHVWSGTIVIAGLTGLLLSYAVEPSGA